MRRVVVGALCVTLMLCALPERGAAQFGPQPPHQVYYQSLTAARVNPFGAFSLLQLTYRKRLFQSSSIFLRDNYVGFGLSTVLSPSFARVGPMVELQPVPFLRFTASYHYLGYFGNFQFLTSYPEGSDPRAVDWSDTALDAGESAGLNYSTTGTQLTLSGTLQAKVGPAAIRSTFRAVRSDYDLRSGDDLVYDIAYDVLVANEGWMTTNDLDAIYLPRDSWAIGVRYTRTRSYFDGEGSILTQRVGPLLAYTFFKEYKERFNGPTLLLILNWWVDHPFRTGEDTSQAFPYVVLGFRFNGDLTAPPSSDD